MKSYTTSGPTSAQSQSWDGEVGSAHLWRQPGPGLSQLWQRLCLKGDLVFKCSRNLSEHLTDGSDTKGECFPTQSCHKAVFRWTLAHPVHAAAARHRSRTRWGHCDVLHVEVLDHQPCCPTRGLSMKSFPPIVKGHQPISGHSMYKTGGTQTRGRLGPQCPRSFLLTTEAHVCTHARPPWLTPCLLSALGLTLGPHSTARPSHHTGSAAGTPCRHQPRSWQGAWQHGHCPLEPEGPPPAPSPRAIPSPPLAF